MLENLLHDVRYALRTLRQNPGFALAAMLSLALGLGLNTALFTVVDAILWRPLPVAHPEGLVSLYTGLADEKARELSSYPDFLDLAAQKETFASLVGHSLMFAAVGNEGRNELVMGEVLTGNTFEVMGIRPEVGRLLQPADDVREAPPVVVISHGYWARRLGSDPAAVGRTIKVRGLPYTIVGVAPASFTSLLPGFTAEIWVPVSRVEDVQPVGMNTVAGRETAPSRLDRRGTRWLLLKGRLAPGVTLAAAQASLDLQMQHLAQEYQDTNEHRRAELQPAGAVRIHPMVDGAVSSAGIVLMAMVGLVLLVAAANVANMILARATARRREIGVRLAVGATRGRLVRQLVVESVLLSLAGGLLGLVLAAWAVSSISQVSLPLPVSFAESFHVDLRVFAFALALAVLTGIVFGLTPALRASRPNLVSSLKNDVGSDEPLARFGLRNALVVVQVAVTFLLLVGASLLLESLRSSLSANLGLDSHAVAIATFDLDSVRLTKPEGQVFLDQLLERVRGLPQVAAAAYATRTPLAINIHMDEIYIDGQQLGKDGRGLPVDVTEVTPGFLDTLRIPLLAGRDFGPEDRASGDHRTVLVNQALAQKLWPGESPLGRRLRSGRADGREVEVIGVTADYKVRTVGEEPRPMLHFAGDQRYSAARTLLVRARGDAAGLVPVLRREIAALQPDLVLIESKTMDEMIGATLLPARAGAILLGAFGLLALALAAVGLYGVIAFAVTQRTQEIGIRMAIGAEPKRVLVLVLRQGLRLVGFGLAIGVVAAFFLGQLLAKTFYGLAAVEPKSYLLAAALLASVALVANWLPARRASRLDPLIALRRS